MTDLDLNWLIGTLIGVVALGFTVTFLFINYTYKKKSDQKSDNRQDSALILKLAQDTKHDQEELAKKVKEEVHEYVTNQIDIINLRIENEIKIGYAKMDLIDLKLNNVCKDIENLREAERDNIGRLEKSIYFLQQFQWGKEAKSIAPYTIGEAETELHSEAEGAGIFAPTEEEKQEKLNEGISDDKNLEEGKKKKTGVND